MEDQWSGVRRTQFAIDGDREARSLATQPRSNRAGQLDAGCAGVRSSSRRRSDSKRTRIGEIERGEATGTPLIVWVRLGIALRRPLAISFSRDLEAMTPSDVGHLDGAGARVATCPGDRAHGTVRAADASREPFLLRRCLRARRSAPDADPPGDLEPFRRLWPSGSLHRPQDRRSGRDRLADRRRPTRIGWHRAGSSSTHAANREMLARVSRGLRGPLPRLVVELGPAPEQRWACSPSRPASRGST